MALTRTQKQEMVDRYAGGLADAPHAFLIAYQGIKVNDVTELRARVRAAGGSYEVVKNTLVQKALNGSVGEAGDALFKGPVAIAFGPDVTSAAKVATQYAKDNDKFTVVGGLMGDQVLDQASIKALASLPSLDQLRAKLIGLIQAPATKIAGVLQAPGAQIARVIGAYAAKDAA